MHWMRCARNSKYWPDENDGFHRVVEAKNKKRLEAIYLTPLQALFGLRTPAVSRGNTTTCAQVLYHSSLAEIRAGVGNPRSRDPYGWAEDVCWVMPRLRIILTSTRRFCARPAAVELSATASALP